MGGDANEKMKEIGSVWNPKISTSYLPKAVHNVRVLGKSILVSALGGLDACSHRTEDLLRRRCANRGLLMRLRTIGGTA